MTIALNLRSGCWNSDRIVCSYKYTLSSIPPSNRSLNRTRSDCAHSQRLICHNAFDGFDLYDLNTRAYLKTFKQAAGSLDRNVSLPALFIHGGQDVLVGTAGGPISIFRIADSADSVILPDTSGASQIGLLEVVFRTVVNLMHSRQRGHDPGNCTSVCDAMEGPPLILIMS